MPVRSPQNLGRGTFSAGWQEKRRSGDAQGHGMIGPVSPLLRRPAVFGLHRFSWTGWDVSTGMVVVSCKAKPRRHAMPMTAKTLSRRGFVQILGAGAAAAALRLPDFKTATAATSPAPAVAVDKVVRLSSNENPYGPSPAAFDAMREAFGLAWRYPDEHVDALVADLAKLHGNGTGADHILAGPGPTDILNIAAAAFPC